MAESPPPFKFSEYEKLLLKSCRKYGIAYVQQAESYEKVANASKDEEVKMMYHAFRATSFSTSSLFAFLIAKLDEAHREIERLQKPRKTRKKKDPSDDERLPGT